MAKDKCPEQTLLTPMATLLEGPKAPNVVSLRFGRVSIDLMRAEPSGENAKPRYVGTPRVGGKVCPHGLILNTDATFSGKPAMKYIVTDGWRLSDRDLLKQDNVDVTSMSDEAVSKAVYRAISKRERKIRDQFFAAALAMVVGAENVSDMPLLKSVMKKALRLGDAVEVVEGELDLDLQRDLGLLDVKEYLVDLAISRGLTFKIDTHKLVSRWVKNSYGRLTGGAWDDASREIATTSSLPAGVAFLVKNQGYKLERVQRAKSSKNRTKRA
jgi:hypothetical protein